MHITVKGVSIIRLVDIVNLLGNKPNQHDYMESFFVYNSFFLDDLFKIIYFRGRMKFQLIKS